MDLGITGRTALVLGASGRSKLSLYDSPRKARMSRLPGGPPTRWRPPLPGSRRPARKAVPLVWYPCAISIASSPAAGQQAAMWRTSFEQMVLVVIVLTDRVLPRMRERGWGRILTSTSSGALSPIPNLGLSNTLRPSLHSWSKTIADEVGRDGVTSNVIVPGRSRPTGRCSSTSAGRPVRAAPPTTPCATARRRWRWGGTAAPMSTPT